MLYTNKGISLYHLFCSESPPENESVSRFREETHRKQTRKDIYIIRSRNSFVNKKCIVNWSDKKSRRFGGMEKHYSGFAMGAFSGVRGWGVTIFAQWGQA